MKRLLVMFLSVCFCIAACSISAAQDQKPPFPGPPEGGPPGGLGRPGGPGGRGRPGGPGARGSREDFMKMMIQRSPLFSAIDKDQNGEISYEEMEGATEALKSLDSNDDNKITAAELAEKLPQRPDFAGRRGGERGGGRDADLRRRRRPADAPEGRGGNEGPRRRPGDADQDAGPGERGPRRFGEEGGRFGRGGFEERLKQLDTDEDGTLSADEIPERMQRLLDRFDADANGALSADELEKMRSRIQERFQQRGSEGEGERPGKPRPI